MRSLPTRSTASYLARAVTCRLIAIQTWLHRPAIQIWATAMNCLNFWPMAQRLLSRFWRARFTFEHLKSKFMRFIFSNQHNNYN